MSFKTIDMEGYHEIAVADYVVVVMKLLKGNGAKKQDHSREIGISIM